MHILTKCDVKYKYTYSSYLNLFTHTTYKLWYPLKNYFGFCTSWIYGLQCFLYLTVDSRSVGSEKKENDFYFVHNILWN